MAPHDTHGSVPLGPGTATDDLPPFGQDPVAWFEAVDRLLETRPHRIRFVRPAAWTDRDGHHWRVVLTEEGPEVRPGLQNPFMIQTDQPRISAIRIGPRRVDLELSMSRWREVVSLPVGRWSVRDLGIAMLLSFELPHDGVDRMEPDVWDRARQRWREQHVADHAPSGADPVSHLA
jgi:hypothetical protein